MRELPRYWTILNSWGPRFGEKGRLASFQEGFVGSCKILEGFVTSSFRKKACGLQLETKAVMVCQDHGSGDNDDVNVHVA